MSAKSWLRFRVPLGFLLAAWYLVLAKPYSTGLLTVAVIWIVLGCALRSWAAGYLLKGKRVAVGGPYAYVRNPLYLGSFLLGIGFALVLYRIPLTVPVLLFWAVFFIGFLTLYRAKSRDKERELVSSLGPAYSSYRDKVPAFLPLRGRVSGLGVQRFSWELYRRNREYRCIWGSVLMLIFLFWQASYGS